LRKAIGGKSENDKILRKSIYNLLSIIVVTDKKGENVSVLKALHYLLFTRQKVSEAPKPGKDSAEKTMEKIRSIISKIPKNKFDVCMRAESDFDKKRVDDISSLLGTISDKCSKIKTLAEFERYINGVLEDKSDFILIARLAAFEKTSLQKLIEVLDREDEAPGA